MQYFETVHFSTLERKGTWTYQTYHRNFRISQLISWLHLPILFLIIIWLSMILTTYSSPPLKSYLSYYIVIFYSYHTFFNSMKSSSLLRDTISLDILTTDILCDKKWFQNSLRIITNLIFILTQSHRYKLYLLCKLV